MKKLALITLCSVVLMANPYESNQEELDAVVKTGQEVSAALINTLGKNLKQHMEAEGPLGAAEFCTTQAYALTADVEQKFGKDVQLKRISLKERNPANKAEGDERAVLQSLENLQQTGVILPEYLVERVNDDTYKYYKPLIIDKQVCLKCHGDISKDRKLSEYFEKSYPDDKATGYKFGDLRGAVVVTIKK
jgi:hypothetical protein